NITMDSPSGQQFVPDDDIENHPQPTNLLHQSTDNSNLHTDPRVRPRTSLVYDFKAAPPVVHDTGRAPPIVTEATPLEKKVPKSKTKATTNTNRSRQQLPDGNHRDEGDDDSSAQTGLAAAGHSSRRGSRRHPSAQDPIYLLEQPIGP